MSYINILSAALTPTIGIAAIWIAFLQWKTNERKRKNELFDKRYAFYEKVELMWLSTCTSCNPDAQSLDIHDLAQIATTAEFLFGEDISIHIVNLAEKNHKGSPFFPDDDFTKPFRKYLLLE